MIGRIFSPQDWADMALSTAELSDLQYRGFGPLTNVLVKISSIGDPYYMDLSPATYMVTLR